LDSLLIAENLHIGLESEEEMFSAKASAAKNLMVVGKLLILLVASPVSANGISDPRFFEYRSGGFINRLADVSFGWFKKLDPQENEAYQQALMHAIMMAENGQKVRWYKNNASGYAVPVMTWPTGSGYCRRLHVQAIAHNVEKNMSATACFDNAHENWRWVSDK
jgi:surface antigen